MNVYIFRAIEFLNLNHIDELFLSRNASEEEIAGKIVAGGHRRSSRGVRALSFCH